MPREWTEEQRQQQRERLAKVREMRKKPVTHQGPSVIEYSVAHLIEMLKTIPLDAVSYDETGELLNVLSATSTTVANARRQKQEMLDAGTMRAPCATCGRKIDISRSGGYQILTERDEHFMPINRYYCSQNCLLGKHLPSHEKAKAQAKQ